MLSQNAFKKTDNLTEDKQMLEEDEEFFNTEPKEDSYKESKELN